jgi:hypothetical protein
MTNFIKLFIKLTPTPIKINDKNKKGDVVSFNPLGCFQSCAFFLRQTHYRRVPLKLSEVSLNNENIYSTNSGPEKIQQSPRLQ